MLKHKLLLAILATDTLMILLHLTLGRDLFLFNLDFEQNIPTTYQGVKLIVTSTVIFTHIYLIYSLKRKIKYIIKWIPFYLIFLFLGVDELSQLHESFTDRIVNMGSEPIDEYLSFFDRFNFSSATWLLIYIPAFVIFLFYVLIFLKSIVKNYKKETIVLIFGSLLFLIVPVVEYINTSGEFWGTDRYENLMIFEETIEMVGGTFLFYFNWLMLKRTKNLQFP